MGSAQYAKDSNSGALPSIFTHAFLLVFLLILVSGLSYAYTVIGGGYCTCGGTCADCTNALNDASCTYINITSAVASTTSDCINDPAGFVGKTLDCKGYTLDGDDGTGDYGVYLSGNSNNIIKNCRITDFEQGIFLASTANNNTAANNTISSCRRGIYVNISSSNNILANNTVFSNTQYGIYVGNFSNNNILSGNSVENNTNYGVYLLQNSSNNSLINNKVQGNFYGIVILSSYNTFINNSVWGNTGGYGIYLVSDHNIITNNNASSNPNSGIYLSSAHNNTLANNTASGNTQNGIQFSSSSNNTLFNNSASGNSGAGINISSGTYNTLTNNTLFNNAYGIYFVTGCNYNNLTGNSVYSNTRDGFYASQSSNNRFTNNSFNGNSFRGLYFITSSNNTLENNRIHNNALDGLYLFLGTNNSFTSNNVYLNQNNGFLLDSIINTTFRNNTVYSNTYSGINVTYNGNRTLLFNNTVYSNTRAGIFLQQSVYSTIANNTARNNQRGIFVYSGSSGDIIANNTVYSNSVGGIYLLYESRANITGNFISSNTQGIVLYQQSDRNNILGNIICNNTDGVYIYSQFASSLRFNTFANNTVCNNTLRGFHSYNGRDNTYANNTVYGNQNGFYIEYISTNNTIINNTACNNTASGIYLGDSSSVNNTVANNTACNNTNGIYIFGADYNTFSGNTAFNNTNGINLYSAEYNTVSGNTAYNNSRIGFFLNSSANYNNISNNTAYNNLVDGIQIYFSSNNNRLINNSAWNNSWHGIILNQTSNNNVLINNTAYNNLVDGIHLQSSSNNTLINNTARNCMYGIGLTSAQNNTLINNGVFNNSQYGFYLSSGSHNNNFTDSSAYNNAQGLAIALSNNTLISNPLAYNNTIYGISINNSNNTRISGAHFHNNGLDFRMQTSTAPYGVNLTNAIFDNPAGNLENFTNLSLFDIAAASSTYSINWTTNSSALPADTLSFAQKFINISTQAGTASINTISWSWLDSELSGYDETKFELWKYNSTGWEMLNNTPDTSGKRLTLYNMNPASDYGILQNNASENCPLINSSGYYAQTANYTGAPNDASEVSLDSYACVKINSSDVEFDCSGFSITGNDSLGTTQYGVLVYGPITNVTLKNCIVSGYDLGIYSYFLDNGSFENNTAYDNTQYGFYLYASDYNNITASSAYNNTEGFYLDGSDYHNLANNSAFNNSQNGFYLSLLANSAFSGNTAFNNSQNGIYLYGTSGNTLANNNASGNAQKGIYLDISSGNNLTNNTAYNNSQDGIYLQSNSNFNNIINNTAYNNGGTLNYAGIYLQSNSNFNNIINNTAYNNSQSGIYLSSSNFNNLINNTATSSLFGIYLSSSSDNNLINNTAKSNANGIRIQSSSSNNIINNNASSNTNGIFILSGINNNLINNTASGNTQNGIVLQNSCNFNNLTNNTASGNTQRGIYLQTNCNFNNLTDNTAGGNLQNGIFLSTSSSNTLANNSAYNSQNGISLGVRSHLNNLTGNSVHNNTYGIVISLSNSTRITGSPVYDNAQYGISINNANSTIISGAHFYNNSLDFWMQTSTAAYGVNITNTVFDNPYGNLENYTNLSLSDIAAASSAYSINWTTNSAPLPGQAISFEQKFVNISVQSGTASIDSIIWSWNSAEEAGYTPSLFKLVKYNYSSGWVYINNTPDTGARTLSAYNLNPQSDYGILQYVANVSALKLYQIAQQPSPGGIVQFNITVTNTGNVTLGTVVWDTLPENLTFSNSYPSYDYSSPPSYGWGLSLNPGQTQIIYINATVDPGAVSQSNPIVNATNYANATGTSALNPPVFAQSYANATIYYANVSAIKLDQTLYQPSPGGIVNFQLNITNIGNVTLDPITLVDTLPGGLDYSNADLAPDSIAGGTLTWEASIGSLDPGETVIILLNATVNDSATATECTVTLTNTIDVEGMPPNGDNVTSSDSEDILIKCANISAIKLDQIFAPPSPGGVVGFQLNVTNIGNVTLNTTVFDVFPENITLSEAYPGYNSSPAPGTYQWDLILDPEANRLIYINATVDAGAVSASNPLVTLTNYLNATGIPPNGAPAFSEDYQDFVIYYANVSLLKVDITPFPPSQGGIVEYRIVVTNTGNVTIDPLEVVDTLPIGFTFSSTDTPGYILFGQEITWGNVGPLSAGNAITILLNATVDAGAPSGTYENTVDAQGTPPNGFDVFASGNATVGVNTSAINIVKTASSYTAMVGDEISFLLNITNSGEINITIYATDTLPSGVAFIDGIPYPDSIIGQELYWNSIGLLEPGQYFEITYNASMDTSGAKANNAIATGVPPNGANATDSASVNIDVASPPAGGEDEPHEKFECITSYDCKECYTCRDHACGLLEGYCAQDSDCTMYGEGYHCEDCLCMHPECLEDSDCAPGFTCENYECVPPECWADKDCPEGSTCEGYKCKEKPPWPEEKPIEEVPVEPEEKPPLVTPEEPEPVQIVEISIPVIEPPEGGRPQPLIDAQSGGLILGSAAILVIGAILHYLIGKKKKHPKEKGPEA